MKKNDIALIVLVVSLSLVASYFAMSAILGKPASKKQKVEVVEIVDKSVPDQNEAIFNEQAIDPTVDTKIGNSSNQQPFQQ